MAVDGMAVMVVDTVVMRLDHGQVMVADTAAAGAQVAAAAGAIMVVARWAVVAEDGAGEVDRHPTKPPLSPLATFTPHTKTRLSLLTKPGCYEKKIETYSNYLNLFTLNLLCTPAECLYTTFTHFGPEVKNCQPIF